jgi:IclR family acetate operon transcriptional repressor
VSSSTGGVQSVNKALDVLEALAEAGGGLPLTDLSLETGIPMATLHRLARTLLSRGYLRQLPDRSYALGAALVPLGDAARPDTTRPAGG